LRQWPEREGEHPNGIVMVSQKRTFLIQEVAHKSMAGKKDCRKAARLPSVAGSVDP
jgi:hypothetical protein